jgi:AsmA protein
MKALRIALAVLGGIIVIVVVAAIILVNTFDPNSIKDNLTAFVQERTGRRLDIEQDIELSLFPWFAVETGGVSLSDDPAFGERDFVRVDTLSARIRVWPLLTRRVEVGSIALDGVLLNLGVDAEGRGNWSTLLPQNRADAPVLPEDREGETALEQLAVEGLELRNASIQWHDASGTLRYVVRDLNLETGEILDDEPVDVSLSLSLFDVVSQVTAALELDATAARAPAPALRGVEAEIHVLDAAGTERAASTFSFDEAVFENGRLRGGPVELSASLTDPPFGATELSLDATLTSLALDTGSETLAIDGLTLRTGGVEAELDLAGSSLFTTPQLRGEMRASGASVAQLFEALGLATPPELTGADTGGFAVDAALAVGLSPLAVTVDRYSLTALGIEARGSAARNAAGTTTARVEVPTFRPGAPLIGFAAPHLPPGTDLAAISSMSLAADVVLPAGGNQVEISNLALTLNGARLGGRLVLSGVGSPARVQGQLTAGGIDNALLAALLGNALPAKLLATDVGELGLTTAFDYARTTGRAVFDPLELTAYGVSGQGRLTVETSSDSLALSGQASLSPFSPRALLTRFGLPVPASADPRALGRAELATSFHTTGSSGSFRDIALTLDDSRIMGEFSVENFADPLYRFELRADRIDADRYLPPKADPAAAPGAPSETRAPAAAAPPAGAGGERRLGDIALRNDALTATRLIGSASVGDLTIGGMRFQQLATDLAIGDGRAALTSVSTELYGGEFTGGVEVDATGVTPALHLRGAANTVALEPLLVDMLGGSSIRGTGKFELDIRGNGETIGEAIQSAAGSLTVSFTDGELDGINLGRELCAGVNALNSLPAPAVAPDATGFRLISGSATISNGVASTSNFYATTGYAELTGTGTMRLADQWQSNDFVARLSGPIPLQGCEQLNAHIDNSIPIGFGFEGKLPDVTPRFDLKQLAADLARRAIRNTVRDAFEDRLREALD